LKEVKRSPHRRDNSKDSVMAPQTKRSNRPAAAVEEEEEEEMGNVSDSSF
jgi:hypothetical protein